MTGGAFACTQADDFDVSADGRLALLRRVTTAGSERLELECFDTARGVSTGRTIVTELPLGSIGFSGAGLMYNVRVASESGAVLVSYTQHMDLEDPHNTRQYYARLFDASCAPVTDAFAWPSSPSVEYYFDAAMTAADEFALVWTAPPVEGVRRVHVAFYDAAGVKTSDLVLNEGSETCDHAVRVAFNRATGAGLVSCQGHMSSPVYIRRFDSEHAWVDAAPVQVNDTGLDASWYESHIIGMNDQGQHVLQWQVYDGTKFRARFFGANNVLTATAELGEVPTMGFDAFRFRHVASELMGDDFLLYDDAEPGRLMRYSAAGVLQGCDWVTGLGAGSTIRTGGSEQIYMRGSDRVVRLAPVDLGRGCAAP